jgi:phage pi2 protein 07
MLRRGDNMINIQIDEHEVREIYLKKLEEKLKEIDSEMIFWDTKELQQRTCMSLNTIKKEFFYHPQFPKFKKGGKWLFLPKETREFLQNWLKNDN